MAIGANELKYIFIMAVIMMIVSPGLLTQLFTIAIILVALYLIGTEIMKHMATKKSE